MLRIRTEKNVTPLAVPDHELLSRALWLYGGVPAPDAAVCNGLGRCGACRVQLMQEEPEQAPADGIGPATEQRAECLDTRLPDPLRIERDVLGTLVDQGWRLACQHTVGEVAGLIVVPPASGDSGETGDRGDSPWSGQLGHPTREVVLAVDLGTTSIHWQALTAQGEVLAGGQALNPQAGAGADIVSRLAVAASAAGRAELSRLVREHVRRVIGAVQAGVCGELQEPLRVRELCVAANTAMTAILLDVPVDGLLGAPYRVPYAGGDTHHLEQLPPLWIPPQPAPFVGGDIAAAMAWVRAACAEAFPLLLIDMGTNGECVLALDRDTVWMTSVPLGPALEGIGLACGGLAGPGAATGFTFGPGGLVATVMGGGSPRVVCGVGVLSLLDLLRHSGVLQADGALACALSGGVPGCGHVMPVAAKVARTRVDGPDGIWRLPLPGGLWLGGRDVEAVLGVRAACAVAVDRLLAAGGMTHAGLRTVLLAGSLGEHAPLEALGRLGFVPSALIGRTRAVGNAALAGAGLLARCPDLRADLADWCRRWQLVDVTADPAFMSRFTSAMRLEATGEGLSA